MLFTAVSTNHLVKDHTFPDFFDTFPVKQLIKYLYIITQLYYYIKYGYTLSC